MEKILIGLLGLSFAIGGYLLAQHTSSILSFGENLFLWITLICIFIWFARHNKYGIYRTLKDIHQSNLDDIERQELEEQETEIIQ
jgi:hypothetical protein